MKGTVLGYKRYVFQVEMARLSLLIYAFVKLYRRGFTNTYHHTALLSVDGVNDTAGSKFYHGKRVAYIYKAQKAVSGSKFRVVWGKIMRSHGTNGVVRAKFNTNLPVSSFRRYLFINVVEINCDVRNAVFVALFSSSKQPLVCFVRPQSTSIGSSVRVMLYPSAV